MMKHFNHMDASSAKEASKNAASSKAVLMAGGTDLLGTLKDEILRDYPETVVNLKTIEGADAIEEDGDSIRIGALAKLRDVHESELVRQNAAALAEAAGRAASPTIRAMGTLGGNICQAHRCWYFRAPHNRFDCIRKGGNYCPAAVGDNRYHSIFGEEGGCYAVSSHDTAPALIALSATIVTTKSTYAAEDFFAANGPRSNVLEDGEVVTEIVVPRCSTSGFMKYAMRKSIDFPIVNCAIAENNEGYRVVLGGVYPRPIRCTDAEAELSGGVTDKSAQAAGDAAVANARPLARNEWKVEIARTLVKRTALSIKE